MTLIEGLLMVIVAEIGFFAISGIFIKLLQLRKEGKI